MKHAHTRDHRSYSKLMAFEASRILHRLGCDVRVFDPTHLPVKNDADEKHEKVEELRALSLWSDGHIWCTPEQHGTLVSSPIGQICHLFSKKKKKKKKIVPKQPSRPACSRTKSTGSPSRPAACARPKAAPSPSSKSTAARNPSTPSTLCGSSGAGCACSASPTNPACRERIRNSRTRAMRGAGCCRVGIAIGWWTAWRSLSSIVSS